MKLTTIKKFNVVISLWLVVIMITLAIFGYELNTYGCFIASAVVGGIAIASNLFTLVSGIIAPARQEKRVSKEYN